MKLPTSRLSEAKRSTIRFVIVGLSGTVLQYALYYVFLELTGRLWPEVEQANACFTLAYVLEVITNYFLTSYYTFSTRPSWKNAGGFLTGRVFNYVLQIGLLNACIWMAMSEKTAGMVAIVIAGVVNYFVMKFFFSKKKEV